MRNRPVQSLLMMRRGLANVIRYGRSAPLPAERVWVDPMVISEVLRHGVLSRAKTGSVRGGEWDLQCDTLSSHPKVMMCTKRWVEGLSWEEAGGFSLGRTSRDSEFLMRRYNDLDDMVGRMRVEGRLLSTTELGIRMRWNRDEIYVHIGRGPRIIFGHKGFHRLSAARAVGLTCVPAVLGVVHEDVLQDWFSAVRARSWTRPADC